MGESHCADAERKSRHVQTGWKLWLPLVEVAMSVKREKGLLSDVQSQVVIMNHAKGIQTLPSEMSNAKQTNTQKGGKLSPARPGRENPEKYEAYCNISEIR